MRIEVKIMLIKMNPQVPKVGDLEVRKPHEKAFLKSETFFIEFRRKSHDRQVKYILDIKDIVLQSGRSTNKASGELKTK